MAAVTFSHFGCTLFHRARCWRPGTSISQYARMCSATSQRLKNPSIPRIMSQELFAVDTSLTSNMTSTMGSLSPEFLANIRVNEEQGLPEIIETRNVPVIPSCSVQFLLSNDSVQPPGALYSRMFACACKEIRWQKCVRYWSSICHFRFSYMPKGARWKQKQYSSWSHWRSHPCQWDMLQPCQMCTSARESRYAAPTPALQFLSAHLIIFTMVCGADWHGVCFGEVRRAHGSRRGHR